MTRPILELKWRVPTELPPVGGEAEVAFLRAADETYRITVGECRIPTFAVLNQRDKPRPAWGIGWEVRLNGEPIVSENALEFLDACYAAWCLFVEIVPEQGKKLARAVQVKSMQDGWDRERMEQRLETRTETEAAAEVWPGTDR